MFLFVLQGELLGSGFFGEVYKVTHRDTNEVMVLKQLYRVDEDAQRNFLKEVSACLILNCLMEVKINPVQIEFSH